MKKLRSFTSRSGVLGNRGFTGTTVLRVANLCDGLRKAKLILKKSPSRFNYIAIQKIEKKIKEGVRKNRAAFRIV